MLLHSCGVLRGAARPASSGRSHQRPSPAGLVVAWRQGAAADRISPEQTRRARVVPQAVRADAQATELDSATIKLISELTQQAEAAVAATVRSNTQLAQSPTEAPASELRAKINRAIHKLSEGLLEREAEVRLLLLASLCGEHLLLLGPPGTAKSELSRRLNKLVNGKYFERLLTRFSVPEELFGPLSMRGLENDQYIRQTEGYLPTAEVAFVDEIFKANSAILNALLTLLNERLFDNGNQRLEAPLLTLVGASNELPESEELDALYDRFLIRRQVAQVSNNQLYKLARLAAGRPVVEAGAKEAAAVAAGGPALSIEDFRHTQERAYSAVDVPDHVIDMLVQVRNYLQDKCEPPIYVSDRRFMKAVQMLQVVAYGDARTEVNEYDLVLLEFVFGNRPDDAQKVRSYVLEVIASDPGLQQTELVFLGLFGRACRLLRPEGGAPADAASLGEASADVASLVELLQDRHASLALALDGGFPALRQTVWQSEASVQASVQALTPQMTENKRKVEELLREAHVLQNCLSRATPASVLERLLPKRFKQFQKGVVRA